MNHLRLFRLTATLAVPLTILAGAAIPAHASPSACDKGCAATTHVSPYQRGFGGATSPNSQAGSPDLRIRANPDLRVRVIPDKVKVLAF